MRHRDECWLFRVLHTACVLCLFGTLSKPILREMVSLPRRSDPRHLRHESVRRKMLLPLRDNLHERCHACTVRNSSIFTTWASTEDESTASDQRVQQASLAYSRYLLSFIGDDSDEFVASWLPRSHLRHLQVEVTKCQ